MDQKRKNAGNSAAKPSAMGAAWNSGAGSNSKNGAKTSTHETRPAKQKVPKIKAPKKTGIIGPLFWYILSFVLICFILPRLSNFNHVIDVNENTESAGNSYYLKMGDEGYDVAHLQRALCNLGYIEFDNVNSRFDDVTLNALNRFLEERGMQPGTECSYDTFVMVTTASPDDLISASDAVTDTPDGTSESTESTTTTASTTSTTTADSTASSSTSTSVTTASTSADNAAQVVKVKIKEGSTRLHAEADTSSATMFFLDKNDEYKLLEKYSAPDGTQWFKIRYKTICDGWIEADRADIIE